MVFDWLEVAGWLDIDRPLSLWCLHVCYLPMLNASLAWFAQRWNNHKIRTAGKRTPEQLFLKGARRRARSG